MAGISIILDLLRKNPSFNGQTLHSYSLFSATLAASTAAASVAAGSPFPSRALFGYPTLLSFLCNHALTLIYLLNHYIYEHTHMIFVLVYDCASCPAFVY